MDTIWMLKLRAEKEAFKFLVNVLKVPNGFFSSFLMP